MELSNVRAGVYFRCPLIMGGQPGQIMSIEQHDRTVVVRWVVPNFVEGFKMDTILSVACEFVSEPEDTRLDKEE